MQVFRYVNKNANFSKGKRLFNNYQLILIPKTNKNSIG